MTTLDKQALEKAKQAYRKNRVSIEDGLEDAIRAYLAALPPATQAWGIRLHNCVGGVAGIASYSEHDIKKWCENGEVPCQVELREVRDA